MSPAFDPSSPVAPRWTTRLALVVATAGGVGFIPFAPGTFGSLVGLLVHAALVPAPPWSGPAVILGLFGVGTWAASEAERHLGTTDPGPVVIDEVVGMLVSLAAVDAGLAGAATAFVLFRLFDIVKPFPASRLERLHGGLGIIADDAMAGIYANLGTRLLIAAGAWWAA
jgi:phosphatidylglycerophosphatase A